MLRANSGPVYAYVWARNLFGYVRTLWEMWLLNPEDKGGGEDGVRSWLIGTVHMEMAQQTTV
jgi:hypothetical protein